MYLLDGDVASVGGAGVDAHGSTCAGSAVPAWLRSAVRSEMRKLASLVSSSNRAALTSLGAETLSKNSDEDVIVVREG
jgi:hypothetical protein